MVYVDVDFWYSFIIVSHHIIDEIDVFGVDYSHETFVFEETIFYCIQIQQFDEYFENTEIIVINYQVQSSFQSWQCKHYIQLEMISID